MFEDKTILITGGTGPFDFLWNNTSTISHTVVGAGFWTCEVIDNNGCFISNNNWGNNLRV